MSDSARVIDLPLPPKRWWAVLLAGTMSVLA